MSSGQAEACLTAATNSLVDSSQWIRIQPKNIARHTIVRGQIYAKHAEHFLCLTVKQRHQPNEEIRPENDVSLTAAYIDSQITHALSLKAHGKPVDRIHRFAEMALSSLLTRLMRGN